MATLVQEKAAVPQAKPASGSRILSVDLLRGLDVLLMLFVNEMAGVNGTPAFLRHTPPTDDGITITDVVFPAFLFIVGMAIPFALGERVRRREPRGSIWRHVLTRTFALLVIGVLMVAPEQARPNAPLAPHLWNVLMTIGVVLAWQELGQGEGRGRRRMMRLVGATLLVILVLAFRSQEATGLIQIRPSWWGILGLIGWAYLVAAAIYLVAGERPAVLTGAVALLYCLYLADVVGSVGWLTPIRPFVSVGSVLGSHAAIVVSGTLLALILRRHKDDPSGRRLIGEAFGYALALAVAALLLHSLRDLNPAFWFHKNRASVPWCLLSSAWTAAAWVALYWIVDVKGWRRWPRIVTLAGENPLLAYLLAPLLLSLFALTAPLFGGVDPYGALGETLWIGTIRSLVFVGLVVALCAVLRRTGIHVRL
jgi:heparan-alpha-glucosaminide N-acetyltransferase